MTAVDRALDALGDPTRRRVFVRLRRGPCSVRHLAQGMEVTRPAVSQHLRVLRDAGLVKVRSAGTRRIYEVDTSGIQSVRKWLDEFWGEALLAFKDAAELEARKEAAGHVSDRFVGSTKRRTRSLPK